MSLATYVRICGNYPLTAEVQHGIMGSWQTNTSGGKSETGSTKWLKAVPWLGRYLSKRSSTLTFPMTSCCAL